MNIIVVLLFTLLGFVWQTMAGYNPFVDGALADVQLMVVDDLGEPVKDARVSAVFLTDVQNVDVVEGLSGSDGSFKASRNCIGEMRIWVRKDGYYETVREGIRDFRIHDGETATRLHRWSDGTVTIPLVLKKVRSPVVLQSHFVQYRNFPATNEVINLDLETLEWCPPYGQGKNRDVELVFDGKSHAGGVNGFYGHLKFRMPHCVDGFYVAEIDSDSSFKYAYQALTNGVFRKSVELRHVYAYGKGVIESKKLHKGEYLIYRVRTQTNNLGQVTHAHYGRIGEGFSQVLGLTMRSGFNPTPNDTNLEDVR